MDPYLFLAKRCCGQPHKQNIFVTRELSLVITASTETIQQNKCNFDTIFAQTKNWIAPGKVMDHKCFVDFVLHI